MSRLVSYLTKGAAHGKIEKSEEEVNAQIERVFKNIWLKKLVGKFSFLYLNTLTRDVLLTHGKMIKLVLKNIWPICRTSKFIFVTAIICAVTPPHSAMEKLSLLWLCVIILSIILQGRYYNVYFIPTVFPISIFSGIGIYKIAGINNPLLFVLAAILLLTTLLSDYRIWKRFSNKYLDMPLEYILWPAEEMGMIRQNLAVYEIIDYIRENTTEEDYIFVWGTVPQTYVLCRRRSPVEWLSTLDSHIRSILPDWKITTLRNVYKKRPKYLIDFLGTINLDIVEKITGLHYNFSRSFGNNRFKIYKLERVIDQNFNEGSAMIEAL